MMEGDFALYLFMKEGLDHVDGVYRKDGSIIQKNRTKKIEI